MGSVERCGVVRVETDDLIGHCVQCFAVAPRQVQRNRQRCAVIGIQGAAGADRCHRLRQRLAVARQCAELGRAVRKRGQHPLQCLRQRGAARHHRQVLELPDEAVDLLQHTGIGAGIAARFDDHPELANVARECGRQFGTIALRRIAR